MQLPCVQLLDVREVSGANARSLDFMHMLWRLPLSGKTMDALCLHIAQHALGQERWLFFCELIATYES